MSKILDILKAFTTDEWLAALAIVVAAVVGIAPFLINADSTSKWILRALGGHKKLSVFISMLLLLIAFNLSSMAHTVTSLRWPVDIIIGFLLLGFLLHLFAEFKRQRPLPNLIKMHGVIWERDGNFVMERPICPKCHRRMRYAKTSKADLIRWVCQKNCKQPPVEWDNHDQEREVTEVVAEEFNRLLRLKGEFGMVVSHRQQGQ